MKIIKIILIVIAAALAAFLIFLGVSSAAEYRPDDITELEAFGGASATDAAPGGLRLISWNIGYCGLNDETDFFLEGGSQKGRKDREVYQNTLDNVIRLLSKQDADLVLLQEVDEKSSRTHRINQKEIISEYFDEYENYFGKNYDALFVPIPVSAPMGRVKSGVMTMSRYKAEEAARYSLPGSYSWPVKVFHLKRCAVVTVLPSAEKGRSWYIVNAHLSAYDNGSMRSMQLNFLREFIIEKYSEGHYVVVGGDWNSKFPGVEKDRFGEYTTPEEYLFWLQDIPEGWTPANWQWCYDPETPTVRSLEQPFKDGENFTTIIDGFLVSPNLRVDEVRGFDLNFKNSDHNPVAVTVSIRD